MLLTALWSGWDCKFNNGKNFFTFFVATWQCWPSPRCSLQASLYHDFFWNPSSGAGLPPHFPTLPLLPSGRGTSHWAPHEQGARVSGSGAGDERHLMAVCGQGGSVARGEDTRRTKPRDLLDPCHDIYCAPFRPGRGIPHMWLFLRFLRFPPC